METGIAARTAAGTVAIALVLLCSACALPGQADPNESFWESFYGTGKSEDEKEKGWWDGFYGKKSDGDPNCSFYGTCKESGGGGGSGWYGGGAASPAGGSGGGGGWGGGPSDAVSGSDGSSGY